ncbi:MAG: hypothetical protein ACD_48C00479G0004 [uncultured bacterium]|nr:MAG: hypothetical protein ACD_48C00479G0004 [uncultured bacterium]
METITITSYLDHKGVEYRESGSELITKCLFSNCDDDSRPNEGHLYFNKETSQYDCKKCGQTGNIITLAKHLGDEINDVYTEPVSTINKSQNVKKKTQSILLTSQQIESMHAFLPNRIRTYLNGRGIPDEIINQYKLGWGEFYGRHWIVIPVTDIKGKYSLLKLRKDPEDTENTNKMMVFPKGAEHQIYGWELLKEYSSSLILCEGEFDRLVLLSNGIPAVTSTGGANTFKDEWTQHFSRAEQIYVCYDRDDAGITGSEKVLQKILEMEHENVFRIDLPEMGDNEKDVTDFFVSHMGNVDSFIKMARRVTKTEINDRIKPIKHPHKPTTFKEWRCVIEKNFPELMFPAELCVSIVCQILVHEIANPFAMVLIGVPSGGKTICLNFFDAIEELTYATDKFTPASFVSNASNVAREKLSDIDLLPRIKNKAFLIRDLATLFSKRDDDLNECLGILTRVLDGEGLSTDTGIHGRRNITGEYVFMMIAASTPMPGRIWKMMGSLGSRLFFYSMKSKEKNVDELVQQNKNTAFKEKERECRKATRNLLYTLWKENEEGIKWNREGDSDEVLGTIARCAKLLAKLRGVVSVWKDNKYGQDDNFEFTPQNIENPDRLNVLFYNLCRGHAVAVGRKQVNEDDLRLMIELAIDSAPPIRTRLFREIINHDGKMTTTQVEMRLKCSKPIALKEMKTLEALGVCKLIHSPNGSVGKPEIRIEFQPDFKWFLSNECYRIRGVEKIIADSLSDLLD